MSRLIITIEIDTNDADEMISEGRRHALQEDAIEATRCMLNWEVDEEYSFFRAITSGFVLNGDSATVSALAIGSKENEDAIRDAKHTCKHIGF